MATERTRRVVAFVLLSSLLAATLVAGASPPVRAVSPSSPAVSPSSPAVGPSSSVPVGDLPGWRQVFVEDFSTPVGLGGFLSVYGDRWGAYPEPWRDTSGRGMYSPGRTLSVSGGKLSIHVHSEGGQAYVAAPQPRLNGPGTPAGQGVLYGRFSVRFRADAVQGFKTAWLLWPDSEVWPADGEIDFPEGSLDATISAYAHYARESGGQDAFEGSGARYGDWHVATTEWTPGKVVFLLDGKVIGTSTRYVPSTPMHYVLQTETELSGPDPAPEAAGNVEIDWFTAYAMQ